VKELLPEDFRKLGVLLRRFLPKAVHEVWMMGSGSVAARYPEIPATLRTSQDVDIVPIGVPVLFYDSKILDRELGEDSRFAEENSFFVDYVSAELLRCTPPGWQERVAIIELAPGLAGHCLDPHDIAYNKLWAGRPKDIAWVHGLLGTKLIHWERLRELHQANPIPAEDRAKVERSMAAVRALVDGGS
jgi:hypothetical protein